MFVKGKIYKRSKIHAQYGGGGRTGISNSSKNNLIFIFTKPNEKEDIYVDEWKGDYFYYSGEGRSGDMKMKGGNQSVLNHEKDGKQIHLFEKTKESGMWKYIDQLKLVDIKHYRNNDKNGDERNAFQFVFLSSSKESKKSSIEDNSEDKIDYKYKKPNETERKGLVFSRVGQGYYREKILERWGGKCAVTGASVIKVLIASHILSWKISTDEERLDVGNGILLSPNLDALFDRYLISFKNDGTILISKNLKKEDLTKLGLNKGLALREVFPDMEKYLKKHRESFYENK